MKALAALALMLISLPASAQWQAVFQLSSLTGESSRISTSLAEAERSAARERRRRNEPEALVAECQTHVDCEGYCIKGRCVEAVEEERARVEPVQPAPAPPLEAPEVKRCSAKAECTEGQSCLSGFCMSTPPPPSSSNRRASELYVRQHAHQLQQDLALGQGPVVDTLALLQGVPAKALGKLLRAHRAELSGLLGDSADTTWPPRFLQRVDQLLALPGENRSPAGAWVSALARPP